jgi:hypothetical protein
MSWFFGIEKNKSDNLQYKNIHPEALCIISTPKLYIAFGGIPETCIVQKNSVESGWAVVGLGIQRTDEKVQFISREAWSILLSQEHFNCRKLDGHFIALRWNDDKIEIFSDQLGLRTMYFSKYQDGICFSTRLDWVAKTTKKDELDLETIAERWLLFNQLSFKSCVQGVERLGPAGEAVFIDGVVRKNTFQEWLPEPQKSSIEHAISLLDHLTNISVESKLPISLSLSGGIDSRTILALILKNDKNLFAAHTFGEQNDPDVQIAKHLVRDLDVKHSYFQEPMPNTDALINMIQEYAAQNLLVEPVSSILRLRYYKYQYSKREIVIDGGFGEIARRQYLNRLKILGSNAIRKNNIEKVLSHLRVHRADIFTPEYARMLEGYAKRGLAQKLEGMPKVNDMGIDNYLDIFAMRTRIPNFGGVEQARSDGEVLSYMPMVQPSFLNAVFNLDVRYRKNGRMYHEIIKRYAPNLAHYPLVKGGTTYPYPLSSLLAWFYVKAKNKLFKPFVDTTSKQFLLYMKDYIYSLAQDVNTCPYYSQSKILGAIDSFYKGDENQRQTVEWWLTFELWRKSLTNK